MKSNFDFLKDTDKELFEIIQDGEKLFRDEYFNQCVIQLRIFSEKTAKKILGGISKDMTFDDTINCLKDKAKNDIEHEFVNDLFFIKKEGNKCAHGETTSVNEALEAIERTFEIAINYARSKKKTNKFDSLMFDKTLLITGKEQKEVKLIDKYIEAANKEMKDKENLLNSKQGDFNSKINTDENGFKDKNKVVDVIQYTKTQENKKGRKKKQLTKEEQETKTRIKQKVKEAKKNLKENINKTETPKKKQKPTQKAKTRKKKETKPNYKILKTLFILLFLLGCIFVLSKMIFVF